MEQQTNPITKLSFISFAPTPRYNIMIYKEYHKCHKGGTCENDGMRKGGCNAARTFLEFDAATTASRARDEFGMA